VAGLRTAVRRSFCRHIQPFLLLLLRVRQRPSSFRRRDKRSSRKPGSQLRRSSSDHQRMVATEWFTFSGGMSPKLALCPNVRTCQSLTFHRPLRFFSGSWREHPFILTLSDINSRGCYHYFTCMPPFCKRDRRQTAHASHQILDRYLVWALDPLSRSEPDPAGDNIPSSSHPCICQACHITPSHSRIILIAHEGP